MKFKIFVSIAISFLSLAVLVSSVSAQSNQNNCVAIAGDSVEHGMVVYPNTSNGTFPAVSTGTIAELVNGGIDFSIAAATLTQSNIYSDQQLVNSGCQYFVVGPWVNDLGQGDAGATVNAIGQIVNDIKNKNPNAKIMVVNYYTPYPTANWVYNIWPKRFDQSRINSFNSLISNKFILNSNVTIIDTTNFGIDDVATKCEVLPCIGLQADGVHLSKAGKTKLANLINKAVSSNSTSSPNQSQPSFSSSSGTAVNGDKVGPELAYPQAGTNVVEKNGFTGTVAVINNLRDPEHPDTPHNTAPHAKVVLRVDVDAATANAPQVARDYANQLNESGEFAPGTIIVFGVELNNLDEQGWNGARSKDVRQDLAMGALSYARLFNAFSSAIRHDKFRVAPAPPDMYQDVSRTSYDPALWIDTFSSNVNCRYVDVLAAVVFDVKPAITIGGGNLDTWQYLEKHICNGTKKVAHFEGWGTAPSQSIQNQINFLRTKELPSPDLTATTLIVNNCGGFGGNITGGVEPNKPWLFWIPTYPDKVFNADGSEFNYTTCTTSTTPIAEYPLKDVPCNDTTDPEFHSLRPYPASPCKKKVEETALMCANDLIVKTTFKVTPNNNCVGTPDGQVCTYKMTDQQSNISINLKNAQFPILGNTEMVPNATWTSVNSTGPNMTAAERMNNYVSWYLNGVLGRAEEDFSSFDLKSLVNYSGPLKKLLPQAVATIARIHSIEDAKTSLVATDPRDMVRHNQIVGCPIAEGGSIVPCYLYNKDYLLKFLIDAAFPDINPITRAAFESVVVKLENRLAAFDTKEPPLESDPKYTNNFAAYWRDYMGWLGNVCTPQLFGSKFYICANLNTFFWSKLFSYVPFSSTEDRKGQVVTDDNKTNPDGTKDLAHTKQLEDGKGNGGTVSDISFVPTSDNHSLYFAHTEEVAQLGQLLQNTYATKSDSQNNWENTISRDVAIHDPNVEGGMQKYETSGCNQTEIRTNSGDNLYGDVNRDGDQQISGNLKYDVTFTCEFKRDPQCISNCQTTKPGDQACIDSCTNTCSKDIYTSLAVYTKTPKIQEIWDRLVNGSMAVFKRFFPKTGQGSVLSEIKDIPGASQVTYASSNGEAKAGMTGKSGSEAQIYFPHLGSIEEYFLNGIQTALRPKGYGTSSLAGQTVSYNPGINTSPQPTNLQCKKLSEDIPVPIPFRDTTIEPKPKEELYNLIKGRFENTQLLKYYDLVVSRAKEAGYNPAFVLTIWIEETGASDTDYPGAHDLGCGSSTGIEPQLDCFMGLYKNWSTGGVYYPDVRDCLTNGTSPNFEDFMLLFAEGCQGAIKNDRQFCYHNTFPGKIEYFYNIVKK